MVWLKHVMNWHTIDVLSFKLNPTSASAKRPCTVDEQSNFTALDRLAYNASLRRLDEAIANMGHDYFDQELWQFRELSLLLRAYCGEIPNSKICWWYSLRDVDFEKSFQFAPRFGDKHT